MFLLKQLETITLAEMFYNEYTRAMLKIFGPHFKHLIFKQCHEVDVSDFGSLHSTGKSAVYRSGGTLWKKQSFTNDER